MLLSLPTLQQSDLQSSMDTMRVKKSLRDSVISSLQNGEDMSNGDNDSQRMFEYDESDEHTVNSEDPLPN